MYRNLQGANQADVEQEVRNYEELQGVYAVSDANDECLLDRSCTFSVMGQSWKERFFENFSNEDHQEVRVEEISTRYQFIGGPAISTSEGILFPCYILGKRAMFTADVVPRNVSFSMSKAEMKQRGFNDSDTDRFTVNGQCYDLSTTHNSHVKLCL